MNLSRFHLDSHLPTFTPAQLAMEPTVFRSDSNFAWDNGGPVTQAFLRSLKWEVDEPLLLNSWFIPPNHEDTEEFLSWHYGSLSNGEYAMATWGGPSLTRFFSGEYDLSTISPVWIRGEVASGRATVEAPPAERMVYFDANAVFRSASDDHARLVIIASRYTERSALNRLVTSGGMKVWEEPRKYSCC